MPDIAPLDSAFMQHRCVHCGETRRDHMVIGADRFGSGITPATCSDFEPIDLPRRDARVPVRREGRVL